MDVMAVLVRVERLVREGEEDAAAESDWAVDGALPVPEDWLRGDGFWDTPPDVPAVTCPGEMERVKAGAGTLFGPIILSTSLSVFTGTLAGPKQWEI